MMALNPAATEFGAAFGNFSEFVSQGGERPRLGSSYLQSLLLPIPEFLYPGKKPGQIAYQFRDRFFPAMADAGAIAGTAYSSLLEAYVNFGIGGGLAVYFLLGCLLCLAERVRVSAAGIQWHLGYLLLVSSAVAFHRSDFSLLTGTVALNAELIILYLSWTLAVGWLRRALTNSTALTWSRPTLASPEESLRS